MNRENEIKSLIDEVHAWLINKASLAFCCERYDEEKEVLAIAKKLIDLKRKIDFNQSDEIVGRHGCGDCKHCDRGTDESWIKCTLGRDLGRRFCLNWEEK